MDCVPLFPTPLWVDHLHELAPYRERWLQIIRDLRRQATGFAQGGSNRNGWYSDKTLLNHPEFAPLQQRLLVAVKAALADHGVKQGSMVLSLHGWANVHDRGAYNLPHVHDGCLLSGTVYLSMPPGAGEIYFLDPRPAVHLEHFPRAEAPAAGPRFGSRRFAVRPEEMQLVIFPSWLSHGVESCECDERISVAFNVEPVLAKP